MTLRQGVYLQFVTTLIGDGDDRGNHPEPQQPSRAGKLKRYMISPPLDHCRAVRFVPELLGRQVSHPCHDGPVNILGKVVVGAVPCLYVDAVGWVDLLHPVRPACTRVAKLPFPSEELAGNRHVAHCLRGQLLRPRCTGVPAEKMVMLALWGK